MKAKNIRKIIGLLIVIIMCVIVYIFWNNRVYENQVDELQKEVEQYADIELYRKNTTLRIYHDSIIKTENLLVDLELENLDLSNSSSAVRITSLEEEAMFLIKRYATATDLEKENIQIEFMSLVNEIKRLQSLDKD
jgi:hypothetical protein